MTREEKAYIKALRSRGVEVKRDSSIPEYQKGKPEDPYKLDFKTDFNALSNPEAAVSNTSVSNLPINTGALLADAAKLKQRQANQANFQSLLKEGVVKNQEPYNAGTVDYPPTSLLSQNSPGAPNAQFMGDRQSQDFHNELIASELVGGVAGAGLSRGARAINQAEKSRKLSKALSTNLDEAVLNPDLIEGVLPKIKQSSSPSSEKLGDLNKWLLPEYKKLHNLDNVQADLPGGIQNDKLSIPIKRKKFPGGLGVNIKNLFRSTDDVILDKRIAAQNKAHASGVDWAERWAYDLDAPGQPLREDYLQKIIETRVKNSPSANYLTDAEIAKEAAERAKKNMNWAANNPDSDRAKKLFYPEGPMGKSENIIATWPNENNAALLKKDPYDFASSGIDEPVQNYINRNHYVQGFKTYRPNPKPGFETSAVTFRKNPGGLEFKSPETIKTTATHEGHHNQQEIIDWSGKLKKSINSSPTLKDNPLAYRIKKAMKLDKGPNNKGEYDWFAQVTELHSDLGAARMELADSWIKAGTFKNRNEAINFMKSPEFLNNDDYIKKLYDTLGGKAYNVSNVRVAGKPANPSFGKHGKKFFKEETPIKERLDILRGLPVAVPVVGAAAASTSSTPEMKRGADETDPPTKKFLEDLDYANKYGSFSTIALRKNLIEEPGMTVTLPDSARYNEIQKLFDYVNSSKRVNRDDTLQYNTNVGTFNELFSNPLVAEDLDIYASKLNPASSTPTTSYKNAKKLQKEIKQAENRITDQFTGDPLYVLLPGIRGRAKEKTDRIHVDYPYYNDPDTGEVVETTGAFSAAKAKMKGHGLLNRVNVKHGFYSKLKIL